MPIKGRHTLSVPPPAREPDLLFANECPFSLDIIPADSNEQLVSFAADMAMPCLSTPIALDREHLDCFDQGGLALAEASLQDLKGRLEKPWHEAGRLCEIVLLGTEVLLDQEILTMLQAEIGLLLTEAVKQFEPLGQILISLEDLGNVLELIVSLPLSHREKNRPDEHSWAHQTAWIPPRINQAITTLGGHMTINQPWDGRRLVVSFILPRKRRCQMATIIRIDQEMWGILATDLVEVQDFVPDRLGADLSQVQPNLGYRYGDEIIPFVEMRAALKKNSLARPRRSWPPKIFILRSEQGYIGVPVDAIIRQELVITSPILDGSLLGGTEWSAVTLAMSGRVVIIVKPGRWWQAMAEPAGGSEKFCDSRASSLRSRLQFSAGSA